ncbi:MAG: hypothetical protein ACKOSO_11400, partial [Actinomycetota bacterium]
MTRIALLGATGSIGQQALAVAAANDDLEVVALAAGSDVDGLCAAARAPGARWRALAAPAAAARAAAALGRPVAGGPDAIEALAREAEADVVLNAVARRGGGEDEGQEQHRHEDER